MQQTHQHQTPHILVVGVDILRLVVAVDLAVAEFAHGVEYLACFRVDQASLVGHVHQQFAQSRYVIHFGETCIARDEKDYIFHTPLEHSQHILERSRPDHVARKPCKEFGHAVDAYAALPCALRRPYDNIG